MLSGEGVRCTYAVTADVNNRPADSIKLAACIPIWLRTRACVVQPPPVMVAKEMPVLSAWTRCKASTSTAAESSSLASNSCLSDGTRAPAAHLPAVITATAIVTSQPTLSSSRPGYRPLSAAANSQPQHKPPPVICVQAVAQVDDIPTPSASTVDSFRLVFYQVDTARLAVCSRPPPSHLHFASSRSTYRPPDSRAIALILASSPSLSLQGSS